MVRKSGVTLSELLQLDCMQQVRIVAGVRGLTRIVTNVNVMEVPDIGDWINSGELLLTTAYSIHKDVPALTKLVPTLAEKGLSGLLLKTQRYLQEIPQQMLDQANALDFPLLELPKETAFSDILTPILSEILQIQTRHLRAEIERRYRNEFLDALLSDSKIESKGLMERARHLGWDLSQDYVAMVLELNPTPGKQRNLDQEHFQQLKEHLFSFLITNTLEPWERYIAGTKSDRIVLLLALRGDSNKFPAYYTRRAEAILQAALQIKNDNSVSMGVGRFYPGILGFRKSYAEALKALAVGKSLFGNNRVIHFSQLGVYRLLQAIGDWDELKSFYQETVAPLDEYDSNYSADLVKTLETYFEQNGNLKQVAQALYIHYNTVFYRMERISEITGFDLKSAAQRLDLSIGLKIRKILLERK